MDSLLASAWSLHQAGRRDEAEGAYRRLLAPRPRDPDVVNCFGILLLQSGRARDARDLYRAFVAHSPGNAALQTNLARAALKLGLPEEVQAAADAAIAAGGGEGAWVLKGVAQRELDLADAAIETFRAALLRHPDSFPLRYNLAACQLAVGDLAGAEQGFAQLAQARPRDASAWLGWGNALSMQGDLPRAEDALRRAATLDPEVAGLRTQLALVLIRSDRAQEALPLLQVTLAREPGDQAAAGALGIAASLVGDAAARPFDDLDRLVACAPLEVSADPGFAEALVAETLAHPSLRDERTGKTTRVGAQTTNLAEATTPALQAFVAALRGALPGRIDALAARYAQTAHPLAGTRPAHWRLNLWATVLRTGGHQAPHMHPAGWMSGVYYLATPGIGVGSEAGWIEFGTPPADLYAGDIAPLPRRRLQPRAGELVSFPSWLYHHTVPHAGAALRISLAFDVVPAQAG